MDANWYVGEAIAGFVYLFVGMRLYLLSLRTGQLPETLIAASFLLWVLAYALYDIPYAFVGSDELISPAFAYGSLIALNSGNIALLFFIRAVFRADARWAIWLVAAVTVHNLAGILGMAYVGDWEGVNPLANPWYWLEFCGGIASSVWMGAEGFAQYFKMRRRLKLGVCEPMACNRFLLWGIAGVAWVVLEAIGAVMDVAYALTGHWPELLGMGIALFEILPAVILSFVFFPPAFYCRWVESASRAENAQP